MEQKTIQILLATYNGERYIRPMIDSILQQDLQDFQLILSDDGSRDQTVQILEEYAAAYPDRIVHYRSGQNFGSAQKHFMHLLSVFHTAPYLMFCDQDDVWHPDKVSKTLQKMHEIEKDPAVPALVHTDLRVVDQDLRELAPSFCRYSQLDGSQLSLRHLLLQNVVTGCTMMINRALAVLSCRRIPETGMLMHDWWLALLAASCGVAAFLEEPTIDYRQHGGNVVGATGHSFGSLCSKFLRGEENHRRIVRSMQQAEVLVCTVGDSLSADAAALLSGYASLLHKNKLQRLSFYCANGVWYSGSFRKLGQILWG